MFFNPSINRRIVFAILVFFTLPTHIFAQNSSDSILVDKLPKEWKIVYQTQQIRIAVLKMDCIDPVNGIDIRKIAYRIENLSNSFIALQWDQVLNYSNKYIISSDARPEYQKRYALKPLATIEGTCDKKDMDQTLFIQMTKPYNEQVLKSFQLINILVSE